MPGENALILILDRLEAFARYLQANLQAGAEVSVVKQGLIALLTAGAGLSVAAAPLLESGKEIARDGLAQQIEHTLFDPSAAAEPALLLMQAHDIIERQGNEMGILARDDRFGARFHWPWEPGVEARVPPSELVDQMIGLAAAMGMAIREARLAWEIILRQHDPRQPLLGASNAPAMPDARGQGIARSLIPLPTRPYRSEAEKVRDLRFRFDLFGARIVQQATDGRKRLERASFDHRAYDPATVVGEAVRITNSLAHILLTCAEIGDLALRPARAPHPEAGGNALPPVPAA